jgi:uncharacterized protein (DUF2336 family)
MTQTEAHIPFTPDDDLIAIDREPGAPGELSKARSTLARRLADVICLPASRINPLERAIAGDLLVEMLREGDWKLRMQCAKRLAPLGDVPSTILRLLSRDDIDVAGPLLETCLAFSDSDLIDCARRMTSQHRQAIAKRKHVSEVVVDVLVECEDESVTAALLRNTGAHFSPGAMDHAVAASRDVAAYMKPLLRRAELRPSHAYAMFWWGDSAQRREILQRYSVGRDILQDAAGDVFGMCAIEGWNDPLARKALQFIERRQRNRAAVEKSPYDSLEHAVKTAEAGMMTRHAAEELSYLAGLKPAAGAKILTDIGGEPIGVFCKATGLKRDAIPSIWRALKRPVETEDGQLNAALERAIYIFDILTVDKAQTVLRYWNWSLTASLTPEMIRSLKAGDAAAIDEFSPPARAAALVFGDYFGKSKSKPV